MSTADIKGFGFYSDREKRWEWLSLSEPDLHFCHCPQCNMLMLTHWLDEDGVVGWVCDGCDTLADDQADGAPYDCYDNVDTTATDLRAVGVMPR